MPRSSRLNGFVLGVSGCMLLACGHAKHSAGASGEGGTGGRELRDAASADSGPAASTGGRTPSATGGSEALAGQRASGGSGASTGGSGGGNATGTGGAGRGGKHAGTGASGSGGTGGSNATGGAHASTGGMTGSSGTSGSPGTAGSTACAAADILLCEDFESTLASNTWSMLAINGGTLTLDSSRSAHGASSLKAHVEPTGGSEATIAQSVIFPTPMNSFYVRAFVYAQSPLPDSHTGLFEATGANGPIAVRLGLGSGQLNLGYVGNGVEYASDAVSYPADRWFCLEWSVNGTTNELHTFIDGTEQTTIAVPANENPAWNAPNYANFTLGLLVYHDDATASGFDFWFDDLAFSKSMIGCDY